LLLLSSAKIKRSSFRNRERKKNVVTNKFRAGRVSITMKRDPSLSEKRVLLYKEPVIEVGRRSNYCGKKGSQPPA